MSDDTSRPSAASERELAVRALHRSESAQQYDQSDPALRCSECGQGWPCRTIRVLDAQANDERVRAAMEPAAASRACWLTTYDLHRLDLAVLPLRRYCSHIYLVGTVLTSPDFRDVDVRMILDDEWFDAEFSNPALWQVFCLAVTEWLRSVTGLPIDFQVQRQSEANAKHKGLRNHLSGGRREYAGMGDGTPYKEVENDAAA